MTPTPAEKRNVLLLSSAQALFQTASVMIMILSGLVGLKLAADKSLATLPIAMMMVAAAGTMIPASLLMQRFGRRAGFQFGAIIGCLAGLIAAGAIWIESFWLFTFANMIFGGYQAFAQYYRFAAAEAASVDFRSRAISWVIAGGVVAAFAAPGISKLTQSIGPVPFVSSYLALFLLTLVALLLISRLSLPMPTVAETTGPQRSLLKIMRQPVFLTALIGASVGYAVMIMVMTATPLAMQMHGHSLEASATVIQWHVLGMFLPSFFTGTLIHRFGVLPIMAVGTILLGGHVVIALAGNEYLYFLSGLTFLGIGWNFLFIGGTSLLTEAYTPSERAKTQAAHDFLMFGVVSIASFAAGGLLNLWGWHSVNLIVLPFLAIVLIAIIGLKVSKRKNRSVDIADYN